MRIFEMRDDCNTIVYAKDERQAQEYFKSTFYDDEVDADYCSVKREIGKDEKAVFEELGEMTFGEFVKDIPESNIPTLLCWSE